MVRSPLVAPLIAVMVMLMLLLPACSRRLPTAPGGELSVSLLLRFPEPGRFPGQATRVAPAPSTRATALAGLDTVQVSIFERIAGRDSNLIASETLALTPGQSSFAIRILVRLVDSYAIRVGVTGTRQRPGRFNPTLHGIQFVGYTITDPATLQLGTMTLDMRDAVPLPRLFRAAGIDSLGWDAAPWPAQYVVRDTLGIIGRTTLPGFRVGRLSTGYRVRAELALGASPVISAYSEALDIASPPSLFRLTPDRTVAGSAGFPLVVEGADFLPGAVVLWNAEALQTTPVSSNSLRADVAAGRIAQPDTVEVLVRNPDGQRSEALSLQVRARPPIVSGISPDTLVAGGADTEITVAGSDFQDGAVVTWNGSDLQTRYTGPGSLVADVPASRLTLPGAVVLRVRNLDLQLSNEAALLVRAKPPILNGVNPDTLIAGGGDTSITVSGSEFVDGAVVLWDAAALVTHFGSPTALTADVPAVRLGATGTVHLAVQNPDLQRSGSVDLVVRAAPPSIVSVVPDTLDSGVGDASLSLAGSGFEAQSVVTWDGVDLQTTFLPASMELSAVVPAARIALPGNSIVQVRNQDGQTSNTRAVVVRLPAPSLVALNPSSMVTIGQGYEGPSTMTLNLSGAHFQPGAGVYWGTHRLAPPTYVSSSALVAAIPVDSLRCSGTVPVTVANPDHRASNALAFTLQYGGPWVAGLTPNTAVAGNPAFYIRVDGCDFQPGVRIYWHDPDTLVALLQLTSRSSTAITALVPSEGLYYSGYAYVQVVNPDSQDHWASFYVSNGTLTPSRPPSAHAPDGKPHPWGSPHATLRGGPPGTAPSGDPTIGARTREGHSP